MYCQEGESGVRFIDSWNAEESGKWPPNNFFSEEARNLQGHRFRVVGLELPPYTNYERDPRGYQFPVTLKPSLDFSILHTMAGKLNFT
ncbi:hypothetical protein Pcinc_005723 [Petrolisthes cinctipes]|uniref:Uncharacterized protein n=1 Tax=Petrolisthes cinctipes TaxID=88211 RepID=A0AAE1GEE7_PETCI|nr:hypothetical protein Pcinc_005723 [Petrolisthes cinctipes]